MTEEQVNAIMGSLLGDACLRASGMETKAIRWNHGLPQEEYVNHMYSLLSEFATRPPFKVTNPGYGNTWIVLTLKSLQVFHSMYFLTRPEDSTRKTVTPEFLAEITHPIALAWWFMDDGSREKNHNVGYIHTNGFSQEEVELLCHWLKSKWKIAAQWHTVKHSSTGKLGCRIFLARDAYLRLCDLIRPFVPECMQYKIQPVTRVCEVCGKTFIQNGQSNCCSKTCMKQARKLQQAEYRASNHEQILEKHAAYREEHREELREKNREYHANLSPERKQELTAYARDWRHANPDKVKQIKKNFRENHKNDPSFKAAKKRDDASYYQKIKQDPEKYALRLAKARERRKNPENRAKEREYLRKRRAQKRAEQVPMSSATQTELYF